MTIEQRTQAAIATLHATGSKAAAAAAFVFPSSMSWSGGRGNGILYSSPAQRGTLWRSADPTESSAVMNSLTWISRNFGQAEFRICATNRKGEKSPIENHKLQQMIERPNPWYGGHTLWAGTLLSYHLDGNAYWLKVRNARGFGVPTEIWYEPHWSIKPHYPEDGSAFIDYYERHVNGTIQKIDPANVVHFRQGLNPAQPRLGLSPLRAALLQIFADQEVDAWVAALCKNMAIPGVIVNPTTSIGMTAEKAEAIKQTWKRKFGGDNRGEPLILDFEAQVSTLGYDPKNMEFTAIHHHAESRIAGALGVPPQLTFLGVANDSSSYNNLTTFERIGWEQGIIPVYENFEDTLDAQLLPDFEQNPLERGVYCEFVTDGVRALKEAQKEKETRILDRVRAGVMSVSAAQAELGMDPDPAAEYYLIPNTHQPQTGAVAAERANTATAPQPSTLTDTRPDNEPLPGKALPRKGLPLLPPAVEVKAIEWNGLMLRREPTQLEAMCVKAIDDLMASGAGRYITTLQAMRTRWAEDLADELGALSPDEFDAVTASATDEERASLYTAGVALYFEAAGLVVRELQAQGAEITDGPRASLSAGTIEAIIDAIATQAAVATVARAVTSATDAVLLGADVAKQIRADFREGSIAYLEQLANEGSNATIGKGRDAEREARKQQIGLLIYSAVLDTATCAPCGRADGQTGAKGEIPDAPNPACLGGARCRCVHLATFNPNADPLPPAKPKPSPPAKPAPRTEAAPAESTETAAAARARIGEIKAQTKGEIAALQLERRAIIEKWTKASEKKRQELVKQINEFDQLIAAKALIFQTEARAALYQAESATISAEIGGYNRAGESLVRESVAEFARLIGRRELPAVKILATADRAFYSPATKQVFAPARVQTIIHELGHHLEESDVEIRAAIQAFYARRTAGDEPVSMATLLPGKGYGKKEVVKTDKWVHPYIGRLYLNDAGVQFATEILSMGLEYFYLDPSGLAEADPEFFDFIFDLLRKRK